MEKPSLKLLVLRTPNTERLKRFFECIGLAFQEEKHGKGPTHHSAAVGDAILEIYPLSPRTKSADSELRLGFAVADLEGVLASLLAIGTRLTKGVQVTEWGTKAVVEDPDGRMVDLYLKPKK